MGTKIIAEFASSWNGDPLLLRAMIKAASENGADICKLQDYRAVNVPDSDFDKKRYEKYQVPDELYPDFINWCKEYNVEPLVTCFNANRAKHLAKLGLKKIKLASISLTNQELIMAAGLYFDEVIASTAMHTNEEVEEAIDLLASNAQKFTIMHCVANYPTLLTDANLGRIDELKKMIEGQEYASVGYSDHSLMPYVAQIAMAKGIKYLEKHFTLSRYLPQIPHQMYEDGPLITTHQISIQPHELNELFHWRNFVNYSHESKSLASLNTEQAIKDTYLNRYGK